MSLDFKNLESIRALTCTLLKEDFNLDVEIPLDRLIPTLPLRLNYLLWIEDILIHNKITEAVKGIDIGKRNIQELNDTILTSNLGSVKN